LVEPVAEHVRLAYLLVQLMRTVDDAEASLAADRVASAMPQRS
jgi:hypothetical protein